MDGQPQAYSTPNPTKFRLLLIILALVALFLVAVALNYFKIIKLSKLQQIFSQKQSEDLDNLPVALDILKNPAVYQWSGAVEGNVTEKKIDSITISKNNHSITISVIPGPNGTNFASQSGTVLKQLSVGDVKIGDYIRGAFFVSPVDKNKIMGSYFSIVQPTK